MTSQTPEQARINRYLVCVPIVGLVVAAVIDLVVGLRMAPDLVRGAREHFGLWGHSFARALLIGVALSAMMLVIHALAGGLRRVGLKRPDAAVLLWTLVLGWGFVTYNESLTQGAKISQHQRVELIRWVIRIGGPVGIFVTLSLVKMIAGRMLRSNGGMLGWVLGLGCVAAALVVDHVNLTRHPNRYPDIHAQLAVASLGLCLAGSFALICGRFFDPARSNRRVAILAVVAFLLIVLGTAVQHLQGFSRVRQAERRLTPVLNEWNDRTGPILARFAPGPRRIDLRDPPRLKVVNEAAIQSALDDLVPNRRDMNVVWIAIDTLRFDHTGFTPLPSSNGVNRFYEKNDTTPRLNELAKEAFVFRRAYTAYPTSNYAYASTLSGLYPRATELFGMMKRREDWEFGEGTAMPDLLRMNGYRTLCHTSFTREGAMEAKKFGYMKKGFDVYNPFQEAPEKNSTGLTDALIDMVQGIRQQKFFLFAHFIDPHDPYPDKHDEVRFNTGDVTDGYDSDIRQTDLAVGRFIDSLKDLGFWDNTLVVLFSDHGEAFGEHGATKHNGSLYEEQIHVPLMIRIPGVQGRVVDSLANITDLLPTTVSFLGVEDPIGLRHGQNLLAAIVGDSPPERYSLTERFIHKTGEDPEHERCLIWKNHKIFERDGVPEAEYQLYDLVDDPLEESNLFDLPGHEEVQGELLALLRQEFTKIDNYQSLLRGAESKSPKERWLEEFDGIISKIFGADESKAAKALSTLRKVIYDSYHDIGSEALRFLGEDGIADLARRLMALNRSTKNRRLKSATLRELSKIHRPYMVEFWKEELARDPKRSSNQLLAAGALAHLGDASGRDVLRSYLASPVARDPYWSATALGLLGDDTGKKVLHTALQQEDTRIVYWALRALDRLDDGQTATLMRDRIYHRSFSIHRLRNALIDAISHDPGHEDALHILLFLCRQNTHSDLRTKCRALLVTALGEDDAKRNIEAMDAVNNARGQKNYGRWDEAETYLAEACRLATFPYSAVRLGRVQILRALRRFDDAKSVLRDIVDGQSADVDRTRARSMLEQMDRDDPVMVPADDFKISARLPSFITKDLLNRKDLRRQYVAFPVTLVNDGRFGIVGGETYFAPRFSLAFRTEEGEIYRASRVDLHFLPPSGLESGSETVIGFTARLPRELVQSVLIEVELAEGNYRLPRRTLVELELQ